MKAWYRHFEDTAAQEEEEKAGSGDDSPEEDDAVNLGPTDPDATNKTWVMSQPEGDSDDGRMIGGELGGCYY